MDQKISLRVRILANELNRTVAELLKEEGEASSGIQMRILNFIHRRNSKEIPVYQKDIEREFDIRRSTATGVLQTMEKRALIERTSCVEDQRLKAIHLTTVGNRKVKENICKLQAFDNCLIQDISSEELKEFFSVADRLSANCKKIDQERGTNV